MVKPGIRKLAFKRSKEINRERQAYLTRQAQLGNFRKSGELKSVQQDVQHWYEKESEKIILQSRADDINMKEKVRIYRHDIHN